jgi:hypothetical protein
MSQHLHLFSNYDSMRLADLSSPVASAAGHPDPSIASTQDEDTDSFALLNLSWIEAYPATQQRFARIGGAIISAAISL